MTHTLQRTAILKLLKLALCLFPALRHSLLRGEGEPGLLVGRNVGGLMPDERPMDAGFSIAIRVDTNLVFSRLLMEHSAVSL